jgi:predicted glycoside hydrolase/deacetylase ChbG (UPF0249 family)
LLGRIRPDDVASESLAQIQKLQRAGIRITHIDTHKHTHLFSAIARPLLEVAESANIRAIRNPFEPAWSLNLNQGGHPRRLAIKMLNRLRPRFEALLQLHEGRVRTTQGTVAISATGQFNATTLAQILAALPPDGAYEICCHPGYNDVDLAQIRTRLRVHRDIERQALLSEVPAALAQRNAPTLMNYANLTPPA